MSARRPVTPRQAALALALGLTLAATVWTAQLPEEDVAEAEAPAARPTRGPRPAAAAAPAAPDASVAPGPRAPWPAATAAQLAAWSPPPPPAPPPAPRAEPPAPPVAPPFPYQLIGRLEQDGVAQALLAGPARSLSARVGDVIDGQWRVERVAPTGLTLTWLPGAQPQTINFRPS